MLSRCGPPVRDNVRDSLCICHASSSHGISRPGGFRVARIIVSWGWLELRGGGDLNPFRVVGMSGGVSCGRLYWYDRTV